jgi:hypothetical protein
MAMYGCNDENIRIIALYKTVAFYLTEEWKDQVNRVNGVKEALATLATPIGGVDLHIDYLDLDKRVAEYTTGDGVVRAGVNSFHFDLPKSQEEYTKLIEKRDLAKNSLYSSIVNFEALGAFEYDGLDGCNFGDLQAPDMDMDMADWKVIQTRLAQCKTSLEQRQGQLSVEIKDPVTAPQKPLGNVSPQPQNALGRLEFWNWGQAKFGDLLDLQKCVNFVNPSPYGGTPEKPLTDDHLLDLVTAKVASLLPALKLENLPLIRAMLNIGLDLTEDDWSKELQKMSPADQQKQEAQYAWQRDETLKFFKALYGNWAAEKALTDPDGRTAEQIIESYAFLPPKPSTDQELNQAGQDPVQQLVKQKSEDSDNQIKS